MKGMKSTSSKISHLFRRRQPFLLRLKQPTLPFAHISCMQDNGYLSMQYSCSRHMWQFMFTCSYQSIPVRLIYDSRFEEFDAEEAIYQCNQKMHNLGRLGNVDEARQLFDEMPQKDGFSYGSMITLYLKHGYLHKAEELFYAMPHRTVVSDSAMVHAYAKADRMDEARRIFDGMPERNVFTWTGLISGYLEHGRVDEASELFQQMPDKNVVTWTTMVLGYARNGFIDKARVKFEEMPAKNVVSWTAMIRAYVENHQVDEALKLFHKMPQRNDYSWNIVIQGCLLDKRVEEAIELFNSRPSRNAISWTILITGLAENGLLGLAREYFDRMPTKDIAAWNAMITAYAEQGLMDKADELFNLMPKRNTVTYNAMINGFLKNDSADEAFWYLIHMLRNHIRPNEATFTSILTSCESNSKLIQAHGMVVRLGFKRHASLTNSLVTMYSKTGDISCARIAFDDIPAKDIVSWTAMILAYSNHGYANRALETFGRMLRSGTEPDEISLVGVLSACSHSGLVKKGKKLFSSMQALNLVPKAGHYSCLVDILGRSGLVNEAVKVVLEMPAEQRDGAVLGAVLSACRLHGDVEVANQVGDILLELEPDKSGAYILLANSYAANGKWGEFAQVRKKMKENKVRKIPGYSQIEINGKSHVFVVGDKSHTDIKEIDSFLQTSLWPLMRKIRHINDT